MKRPTREDATLLLTLYDLRRESALRRARTWFFSETEVMTWEERKAKYPPWSEGDRFIRMVATYWDMAAALVNHGLLDEDLFFETNAEDLALWDRVKTWLGPARAEGRITFLRHFESMVRRHQAWREELAKRLESAPSGSPYPLPSSGGEPRKSRRESVRRASVSSRGRAARSGARRASSPRRTSKGGPRRAPLRRPSKTR